MVDTSRSVSGTLPGPGADPLTPSGPAPSGRVVTVPAAVERRRPLAHTPSSPSAEADPREANERTLIELRRKVQSGELLSASTERLLWKMRFNGHLTVVIHNGRVLKSGYEEGYFRRRHDLDRLLLDA